MVDTDDAGWKEREGDEWVWREDRMAELLASEEATTLYVAGCVPNQGKFYDRFHAVVLLSAPAEVILERTGSRTANPYGKTERERAAILEDLTSVEPLLRKGATHEIDATRSVSDIVKSLIEIAEGGKP